MVEVYLFHVYVYCTIAGFHNSFIPMKFNPMFWARVNIFLFFYIKNVKHQIYTLLMNLNEYQLNLEEQNSEKFNIGLGKGLTLRFSP